MEPEYTDQELLPECDRAIRRDIAARLAAEASHQEDLRLLRAALKAASLRIKAEMTPEQVAAAKAKADAKGKALPPETMRRLKAALSRACAKLCAEATAKVAAKRIARKYLPQVRTTGRRGTGKIPSIV